MRLWIIFISVCLSLCANLAWAENRYASIIVDADTLDIIHARQIDAPRFPASLTKIMTLYLVFDALETQQLRLDEKLTVSRRAARTSPVKLGLAAGQTISVDALIRSVAVRSHNDSAVILAERLAGSEERFAELMTAKAHELGMLRTTFKTANGLPHPDQKTTARDMAKLANAVLRDHGQYYHYFGQKSFRGQRNTNKLLEDFNGVDGFKTGYTRASGYNLLVSAKRGEHRLIAVILGGASGDSRNQHMRDLVERGFEILNITPSPIAKLPQTMRPQNSMAQNSMAQNSMAQNSMAQTSMATQDLRAPTIHTASTHSVAGRPSWAVALRNLPSPNHAANLAQTVAPNHPVSISQGRHSGRSVHHIKISELNEAQARGICAAQRQPCWLIAP